MVVGLAVFAPWIAPFDPNGTDLMRIYERPSRDHLLGTDNLGRDQLSRIIFGTRTSMLAAVQAVGLAMFIGVPIGLAAGYLRGWVDTLLSRINDAVLSVPGLILAIAVVSVLGPGLSNTMLAVGLVMSPWFFRVVRAATLNVRDETYIEASIGLGCSERQVLVSHVVPNIMAPLLVQTSFALGFAVIIEASLSFLGLGVRPPTSSWGGLLLSASQRLDIPHLIYPPGVALVLTIAVFTVLGDAWRDSLGVDRSSNGG